MLYIGIDLHGKQFTVCIRDEAGNVTMRRQVSTRSGKADEFFEQVHGMGDGKYVAILEVCGFHDWLVDRLQEDKAWHTIVMSQT